MRLVLYLEALKSVTQNNSTNAKFYTGMHGWIYRKLKGTNLEELYAKKTFKPFCFSNIFPVAKQKIQQGHDYKIIISSPSSEFIQTLFFNVNKEEKVNLGEFHFKLSNFRIIEDININSFSILETMTLINITRRTDKGPENIDFLKEKDQFLEGLRKNLIRKYNHFQNKEIQEKYDLFKNCMVEPIRKQLVKLPLPINKDNKSRIMKVGGNQLQFKLGVLTKTQKDIFKLCYDLGFGERNSYGMGFMNLAKSSDLKDLEAFDNLIDN